jgi:PTH1 family peptidyl-tRNA hydrolase
LLNNMKLIAGLGNPGKNYAHNRHNLGFQCINYIAKKYAIAVKQIQCQSKTGKGRIAGTDVILAKPRTYVNNSGNAIASLMQKHRIPIQDIVIIYDDMDLPVGKIRIRPGGNPGGHKGIKSIISSLGSRDFCRIKIGIGRPVADEYNKIEESDIVDYVLSNFSAEEQEKIDDAFQKAAEAVECIITDGVTAAMNKFN